MSKPELPSVIGQGPLADAMRREIDSDPDRYRPHTYSRDPVAHCPACGLDVYRVKSKLTQFEEAFATGIGDDAILHPRCNDEGIEDPKGERIGACKSLDKLAEWAEPGGAELDPNEVLVGDVRRGTGTHGILVQVLAVDGADASCTLVRSGKKKTIKTKTLREAYTLVRRGEAPPC